MMPIEKQTANGRIRPAAIFAMMLFAMPALAADNKAKTITPGEIAMYIGIIILLIAFAWWLATRDKKSEDRHHASVSKHGQGQHHHSNDPYFKRPHKR